MGREMPAYGDQAPFGVDKNVLLQWMVVWTAQVCEQTKNAELYTLSR